MVKVKIRTGRGTGTIEVDVKDLKFSGEEFKKKFKLKKRKLQETEQFQLEEVQVEENFQILQNQKLDLQPNLRQNTSGRSTGSRKATT